MARVIYSFDISMGMMMLRGIEVVFFDAGGTLWFREEAPEEVHARVLERFGIIIPSSRIAAVAAQIEVEFHSDPRMKPEEESLHIRRFYLEMARRLGYEARDEIIEALETAFAAMRFIPYPDSKPVLEALLNRGFRLGIISNASSLILKRLNASGLRPYFESVTYSEDVGAEKPDRRIFQAAVAKMRTIMNRSVHIGDSYEKDFLGAENAGMHAIWLNRLSEEASSQYIKNLSAVLSLVER